MFTFVLFSMLCIYNYYQLSIKDAFQLIVNYCLAILNCKTTKNSDENSDEESYLCIPESLIWLFWCFYFESFSMSSM